MLQGWLQCLCDALVIPIEIENVEKCSTFENVDEASPSCPHRCGDSFLIRNYTFVIGDVRVAQFFSLRFITMHGRLI